MKIKEINRMVVKIGSSLLIDKDKGVNNNFLNNISEDILSLKKKKSNSCFFGKIQEFTFLVVPTPPSNLMMYFRYGS